MGKVVFQERGRVQLTDENSLVISDVVKDGELIGLSFNKYIESEKYTGFTKGFMVPMELLDEVVEIIQKED
jgi:hypothetical protein